MSTSPSPSPPFQPSPSDDARSQTDGFLDLSSVYLGRQPDTGPAHVHVVSVSTLLIHLGTAIRAARLLRGLTPLALAKSLSGLLNTEVGASFVARLEERGAPTLDHFGAAALALGFPPSALMVAAEAAIRSAGHGVDEKRAGVARFLTAVEAGLANGAALPAAARDARLLWRRPDSNVHAKLAAGIGTAVRWFRICRGLNQAALADAVRSAFGFSVTKTSLSKLEMADAPPSWTRLAAVAAVLDVSFGDLFATAEREIAEAMRPLGEQVEALNALIGRVADMKARTATPAEQRETLAALAVRTLTTRRLVAGQVQTATGAASD
jgi:transcriptional regulator with XRE-family HTH domain